MSVLIDADELLTHVKDLRVNAAEGYKFRHRYIDPQYVYDAPIVDAVPVVRCRDCKHKKTATGCCAYVLPDRYGIGTEVLYCRAMERYVEHDFFCKYGEKVTE